MTLNLHLMVGRKNVDKFAADDPLRYMHVRRTRRLAEDGGTSSDASVRGQLPDDDFDREVVKTRGGIVGKEDLS